MKSESAATPSPDLFVGRETELKTIVDRLTVASRGDGGIVLISGEPGVGKTRLLLEAAAGAEAGGWRVLLGHAYDTEGMPPYLPFIEALQSYVRVCPIEELEYQLGAAAGQVALIMPEIRRRLRDLPAHVRIDAESARYALFEGISEFLEGIARAADTGLLLGLEDFQWADDSTLFLLEHLVRRTPGVPILIVVSYRDTELDVSKPLARTLEQFGRSSFPRLDVKCLSETNVGRLLASLGQPDPPQPLIAAVYKETEGNAFFVREVFEYLARGGRLFDKSGAWRTDLVISEADVPQGVRLVIGRRLEGLGEECRHVLTLASIMGRIFDGDVLLSLLKNKEELLLESLDEAARSHLVVEVGTKRLAFAHELVRQTILAGLSLSRRQRLHFQVGEAIEETHASNLDAHVAELAFHFSQGTSERGVGKTYEYAVRGGDRAHAQYAYEEAVRLYRLAQEAIEGGARVQSADIAKLHTNLGYVLMQIGGGAEITKSLNLALETLGPEQKERRIEILIALSRVEATALGNVPDGIRHAQNAVALAEESGAVELAGEALAILANAEVIAGDLVGGLARFDVAVSEHGFFTKPLRSRGQFSFGLSLYWAGRTDDAIEQGRRHAAIGKYPSAVVGALGPLGLTLAAKGQYDEAQLTFDRARALIGENRWFLLPRTISMSSGYRLDLYDYQGAEALSLEARGLAYQYNYPQTISQTGIDLILNYSRRADVDRAENLLAEVRDAVNTDKTGPHVWVVPMRFAQAEAELLAAKGDWRGALSAADDTLVRSRTAGRRKYESLALETRGRALAGLGRKREGIAALQAAIDVARLLDDPALSFRATASLLAVEPDTATSSQAISALGRILDGLSDPLLRNAFQAAEPVKLVLRLSTESGVGASKARNVYPDNLTEREVDVLRLIVLGKSSREIAEELILSVRTVERHISNAYLKTGSNGRAQATAYAIAHGIS